MRFPAMLPFPPWNPRRSTLAQSHSDDQRGEQIGGDDGNDHRERILDGLDVDSGAEHSEDPESQTHAEGGCKRPPLVKAISLITRVDDTKADHPRTSEPLEIDPTSDEPLLE